MVPSRSTCPNGRNSLRNLAIASLLVVAVSSAQERLPSVRLPPELDRVLRDYETAWHAHDPVALAGIFAEDGFVLRGQHVPVRGRSAIQKAYDKVGGPLELRALDYSISGSTGWIIGAYGQDPSADVGKFVLALKRVRGRWYIAADIDNSNSPPPARKESIP
jgi:ketosteroid isomerase-like protein